MKPGDRFRFTAEGVVVEKTPGVHGVTFDGHEHSRLNYLLDEFFVAHAEIIAPPYVPQAGDIVRLGSNLGTVTATHFNDGTVDVDWSGTEIVETPRSLTLVARPGEVYQP